VRDAFRHVTKSIAHRVRSYATSHSAGALNRHGFSARIKAPPRFGQISNE